MYCQEKLLIAKNENPIFLLPQMANRHGLITGATGTGKTVTVKVLAEAFSDAGVPVFLSDIKGDLSGMGMPGEDSERMQKLIAKYGLAEAGFEYKSYPTVYWDVFAEKGIPVRTTVSEMGPLLLSRLMNLTDVQEGVLDIIFKIADDKRLLLLDLKDLRAMVQHVGDNANQYKTGYGNITTASIGSIQRGLLKLESQGADKFFGEPALDITDWIKTDADGRGMVNVLNCEKLFLQPDLYAAFLLWMLSELYETLPEVGDAEKPKVVFFFDEAHLLFNIDSKELLSKVEQVIRLIRSKGVGVYFISQSPTDIPDGVLSQLGNKIQHALRAYTPSDQKAVKAAAQSFMVNPAFDTAEAITQLGTGEALVSFLDEKGAPTMVQRAGILCPQSLMGTVDKTVMEKMIAQCEMGAKYNNPIDRESAYEIITGRVANSQTNGIKNGGDASESTVSSDDIWTCSCGEKATGKFCSACGAKRTDGGDIWVCSCGEIVNGNFCPNCGAKKTVTASKTWTCSCGKVADGNFCPVCGTKRPENEDAVQATTGGRISNVTDSQSEGQEKMTETEKEIAKLKAEKEALAEQLKEEKKNNKKSGSNSKSTSTKKKSSTNTEIKKAAVSVGRTAANSLVRGVLKNLLK